MKHGGPRLNSGGYRPGAGRKPEAAKWPEEFKGALMAALGRKAEATGRDCHEVLVETLYADGTQDSVRVAIYKLLQTAFLSSTDGEEQPIWPRGPLIMPAAFFKLSETDKDKILAQFPPGPRVILPEMRPDPARQDRGHRDERTDANRGDQNEGV